MRIKRGVCFGDFHSPYHSMEMVQAVRRFVEDFKPHEMVFVGDQLNYAAYSGHGKRKNESVSEVIGKDHAAFENVLDTLTSDMTSDLIWLDGNHDAWQDDYYTEHSDQFDSSIHRYNRLRLKERGFTKILPYKGGVYKSGKLHFTHGWRAGVNAVRDHLVRDFKANFVMGHIHKSDTATTSNIENSIIQGYSVGCMSKLDFRYAKGQTANNGFGIYYVLPNGNFTFYNIVMVNGRFIFEGQLYE